MDSDELFIALSYAAAMGGAGTSSSAKPAAKPAAKKAVVADDDFDMFGDDEEEDNGAIVNDMGETASEAKAAEARRERMAAAAKLKAEADAKKNAGKPAVEKKAKPAEKSLIVLDVKPWEADTDLAMVWREICKTEQEGLTWGQSFELHPLAFGIKKLVMTVTIVDALVLMDDVTDKIEALEDWVQSVEIASMNKIS